MAAVTHPELLPLPAELRGERVVLRPYREGDCAAFFAAVDRHREDFLHKDARGKGYGAEAVKLVTDWALHGLGAVRVWASVDVKNPRSSRLLERCGFSREAHLHQHCRDHHGTVRDTYLYAVTSDVPFQR